MFLIRIFPFHDEGFYSYVIRMAKVNKCSAVVHIYQKSQVKYNKGCNPNIIKFEKSNHDSLISQVGQSVFEKSNFMYQTNSTTLQTYNVDIYGITLQQKLILKKNPKFCPLCMEAKGYIHNIWQFITITTCYEHSCMLIDKCPCCNKRFIWDEFIVEGCTNCFVLWSEIANQGSIHVADEDTLLTKMLSSKVGLYKEAIQGQIPGLFYNLSFESCVNLISLIAWTFPGEDVFRQMLHIDQKDNIKTHTLLMKVIKIFMDWPKNFNEYLNSLLDEVKIYARKLAKAKSSRIRSPIFERNLFEIFFKKLYEEFSDLQYDFVREEFEKFLSNNLQLVYGRRTQKFDFDKLPFYTITTLQRKYGLQGNRVREYIERGIFKAVEINIKGKKALLIQKESVHALLKMYRESLSREEAGKILGIHRIGILTKLHRAGCINAVRGPEIDGFGHWRFDSSSVYKLLECFEQSMVLKDLSSHRIIEFQNININLDGYTPNYVELIIKVQKGELKPCGKVNYKNGLNQYCFDRMDLRDAFSEEIKCIYSSELSLSEAARRLKMDPRHLSHLLDNGYLKYCVKSKRLKFINLDDFNEFTTKYISLGELLRYTNTNSSQLLSLLETKGFKPLNEKKDNANHVYLFERSRELIDFIVNI